MWKDGDMQSRDMVACGCLLDFSPEEWNSDVSSVGFMRAHKSTSDKSGQLRTTWESQASGAFYLNEGFGGYPRPPLSALILMRGQQIEKWLRLSLRPTKIRAHPPDSRLSVRKYDWFREEIQNSSSNQSSPGELKLEILPYI